MQTIRFGHPGRFVLCGFYALAGILVIATGLFGTHGGTTSLVLLVIIGLVVFAIAGSTLRIRIQADQVGIRDCGSWRVRTYKWGDIASIQTKTAARNASGAVLNAIEVSLTNGTSVMLRGYSLNANRRMSVITTGGKVATTGEVVDKLDAFRAKMSGI